jgi:hypothetical protein
MNQMTFRFYCCAISLSWEQLKSNFFMSSENGFNEQNILREQSGNRNELEATDERNLKS